LKKGETISNDKIHNQVEKWFNTKIRISGNEDTIRCPTGC